MTGLGLDPWGGQWRSLRLPGDSAEHTFRAAAERLRFCRQIHSIPKSSTLYGSKAAVTCAYSPRCFRQILSLSFDAEIQNRPKPSTEGRILD